MKNPSPREAFTLDDARQILLDFRWKNESHRFFNLVGALTGMRLSELHAIRKDNLKDTYIDLQDQFLNGKLRPLKTKEARKIPICEELHGLLSERISKGGNVSPARSEQNEFLTYGG